VIGLNAQKLDNEGGGQKLFAILWMTQLFYLKSTNMDHEINFFEIYRVRKQK